MTCARSGRTRSGMTCATVSVTGPPTSRPYRWQTRHRHASRSSTVRRIVVRHALDWYASRRPAFGMSHAFHFEDRSAAHGTTEKVERVAAVREDVEEMRDRQPGR